jgi:hypothetical protein
MMDDHEIARWIAGTRTPGGLPGALPVIPVRIYEKRSGSRLALTYNGWLVGAAVKRSGQTRIVVEDEDGQLHIHEPGAATEREP